MNAVYENSRINFCTVDNCAFMSLIENAAFEIEIN